MGRKKLWSEDMGARFPEGTFARIDRVRERDETRTDFVRVAVELELERRGSKKRSTTRSAKRNHHTTS